MTDMATPTDSQELTDARRAYQAARATQRTAYEAQRVANADLLDAARRYRLALKQSTEIL